ncbi:MAG: neutral/alkaline non-lysosomal ceramidase N-terminal domain-containing protein, partial [Pseudomonadales bacterium]|nr:neutral/alkaline non-lysosomal ceramidase N-terminal domain-containing protein [Pseudomonadales bacterium]
YCNDYMGYVTTYEEYQQQAYEGGHTIYGQWTLAAFQTCFAKLAEQFALPADQRQYDQHTQPLPAPVHELALRTNLTPPRR